MRTYGNVGRIIATLWLMAVGSLWSKAILSANPPTLGARPAAISTPTLDLRPPDLQNLQAQLTPEATQPADADEASNIIIVGAHVAPEERSNLARTGIGSLYWAARHPLQAWRALLPIAPNDESATSLDLKAACANVLPPAGDAACP